MSCFRACDLISNMFDALFFFRYAWLVLFWITQTVRLIIILLERQFEFQGVDVQQKANGQYWQDMWQFGALAYQMCVPEGRPLWHASLEENVEDAELHQLAFEWEQLEAGRLRKVIWQDVYYYYYYYYHHYYYYYYCYYYY